MAAERLDKLLLARGLAESRERAQRLILAGAVRVNDRLVDKPAAPTPADARVEVIEPARFVSRGGEKLDAGLNAFGLDVAGRLCVDVGASTGGFTDCLLQRGAECVHAFDVGRGQLHWKLRQDPRVIVHEGVNARYLKPADLPAPADFACVDVSFISLTKILPAVIPLLRDGAPMVTLIKPQFEAGRAQVGAGGVVTSPAVRADVVERIRAFGVGEMALDWLGCVESPLKGPAGNVEFLAGWRKRTGVTRA